MWLVYPENKVYFRTPMTLFRSRYRIETTRLKYHSYMAGWYFVTICTRKKLQWFGEIRDQHMMLSDIGKHARQCWLDIPKHFPHASLDAFVIMPDHVHGVIVIHDLDRKMRVEPQNFAALQTPNRFGPQSKNLASIIRGFKIGVTKYARANKLPFFW